MLCSLLFYDHVALFKLYQISHGRYHPFTPCWHWHNRLLRILLISPIIRIGIASYTSIFFCASDLLHYHWANSVLEYHPIILVQIEIGEAFEERHWALMDQPSRGSADFIVVHGFVRCDLPYLGDIVGFGRHVEVCCCDFMPISGNDQGPCYRGLAENK